MLGVVGMIMYVCPFCGFKTPNLGGFKMHVLMHVHVEKDYVCPACGKRFSNLRGVLNHIYHVKYYDCMHALLYFIYASPQARQNGGKNIYKIMRECYAIEY